ncbi:MAG: glycosyltransferase [Acidobacteriota bacterium]
MKILTVTSSYPKHRGDTTAPFIQAITRALAARGHELAVVLPACPELDPEEIAGVSFHPYRYAPLDTLAVFGYAASLRADVALRRSLYVVAPLALASGTARLLTLARRGGFDLLHAHWMVPNGAMALPAHWIGGLPLVVSLHGSDVFLSEKKLLFRRAARRVLRSAAAITACSDDLAQRSLQLGARRQPITVPYGVDTSWFRPRSEEASELRRRLGLSPHQPTVLAVGRLVHKKGFEVLVDATPHLLSVHPDLVVLLAGTGDLADDLMERARGLGVAGRIRLVGTVPHQELAAYYAAATLVAVPSVRDDAGNVDGLPNVLLEAMASGTPVVASAVAGIPQAARHDEEALLVPERHPQALAGAMLQLLASPERRARLGARARARARQSFSWSKVGEQFEALFRSVAGIGRPPA